LGRCDGVAIISITSCALSIEERLLKTDRNSQAGDNSAAGNWTPSADMSCFRNDVSDWRLLPLLDRNACSAL
jgi:hypothetical protein